MSALPILVVAVYGHEKFDVGEWCSQALSRIEEGTEYSSLPEWGRYSYVRHDEDEGTKTYVTNFPVGDLEAFYELDVHVSNLEGDEMTTEEVGENGDVVTNYVAIEHLGKEYRLAGFTVGYAEWATSPTNGFYEY